MRMTRRINKQSKSWTMKIESHMGANRHDFGAKSGPSDQIGQPGHLASTCVHHNIGNELTVEVN